MNHFFTMFCITIAAGIGIYVSWFGIMLLADALAHVIEGLAL